MYIKRDIEEVLKKLLKNFSAIAITGARQSGKSTLLINLLKNYKYVTLDDLQLREQALVDPIFFLDNIGEKVIIDEIQYASQLLSYIKIRIDKNRLEKGLYVFTGSQQFNMMKNLGDSLAGRIGLIDLLPFSYKEKKRFIKIKNFLDIFVHACLVGSYPEIAIDSSFDVSNWYNAYVQTYLERDIRSLYNIGSLNDFQKFIQLLAARCSQILNLSEISRNLGISVPTIKKWISILESSKIIYCLQPYYNNFGKRITKAPKVYFMDVGLVCYLTGIKSKDHLLKGPLAGALFENYCIQETLKVFYNNGKQPNIYYLRTNNGLEVDILIEKSYMNIMPVEIKLSKTPKIAMASNIEQLKKLFSKINFSTGKILSIVDKTTFIKKDLQFSSIKDYLQCLNDFIL